MFFFSQGRRPYVFFFWLGGVLFNLCKQTTQLWFNLLPYCVLQGGCQFRDFRYGDRNRRNSVTNIIGTKHKSTEGTNQSSEFEFELKFECSFSFFRCFVVSINSYGMDKNGRSLELGIVFFHYLLPSLKCKFRNNTVILFFKFLIFPGLTSWGLV